MCENVYDKAWEHYEATEYQEAYTLFLELAKEGEVLAQNMVANMAMQGMGVEQNSELGYQWYYKAAQQNDAEALYQYGWYALENNQEEKGLEYMNKACDAEYLHATYDLAGFYYHGVFTCNKDLTKASELYEKSIMLGKAEACDDYLQVKFEEIGKVKTILLFIKMALTRSNLFKQILKLK